MAQLWEKQTDKQVIARYRQSACKAGCEMLCDARLESEEEDFFAEVVLLLTSAQTKGKWIGWGGQVGAGAWV